LCVVVIKKSGGAMPPDLLYQQVKNVRNLHELVLK